MNSQVKMKSLMESIVDAFPSYTRISDMCIFWLQEQYHILLEMSDLAPIPIGKRASNQGAGTVI